MPNWISTCLYADHQAAREKYAELGSEETYAVELHEYLYF